MNRIKDEIKNASEFDESYYRGFMKAGDRARTQDPRLGKRAPHPPWLRGFPRNHGKASRWKPPGTATSRLSLAETGAHELGGDDAPTRAESAGEGQFNVTVPRPARDAALRSNRQHPHS